MATVDQEKIIEPAYFDAAGLNRMFETREQYEASGSWRYEHPPGSSMYFYGREPRQGPLPDDWPWHPGMIDVNYGRIARAIQFVREQNAKPKPWEV